MIFETLYKEIGKNIAARRNSLNLTQAAVVEELKRYGISMSRASVANIEAGRQAVLVHQLYGLAHTLDIQLNELLPLNMERHKTTQLDLKFSIDMNPSQESQIQKLING